MKSTVDLLSVPMPSPSGDICLQPNRSFNRRLSKYSFKKRQIGSGSFLAKDWPRELCMTLAPLTLAIGIVVMLNVMFASVLADAKGRLVVELNRGMEREVGHFLKRKMHAGLQLSLMVEHQWWTYSLSPEGFRRYEDFMLLLFADKDLYAIYQTFSTHETLKFHRENVGSLRLEHRQWNVTHFDLYGTTHKMERIRTDGGISIRNTERKFYDPHKKGWVLSANATVVHSNLQPQILWIGPEFQSYNDVQEPVMNMLFKTVWPNNTAGVAHSLFKCKFKTSILNGHLQRIHNNLGHGDIAVAHVNGNLVAYPDAQKQVVAEGSGLRFQKVWDLAPFASLSLDRLIQHSTIVSNGCAVDMFKIDEIPEWIVCIRLCDTNILGGFDGYRKVVTALTVVLAIATVMRFVVAIYFIKRSKETLLLSIFPPSVVLRLLSGERDIHDNHPEVSILFADVVGFTETCALLSEDEVFRWLKNLYALFDDLSLSMGVEKIKTIGDCYMAMAGAPEDDAQHAHTMFKFALAMLGVCRNLSVTNPLLPRVVIRIGVATGPAATGVLGKIKFLYDVWGDTVNLASRVESTGRPGHITISKATYDLVRPFVNESQFVTSTVSMKGKGDQEVYTYVGMFQEAVPQCKISDESFVSENQ